MDEKRAAEAFRVKQHAGTHPARLLVPASPHQAPLGTQPCLKYPAPDTDRVILHFDADCFYAQCEELRDPRLRSCPLAVTQKFLIVTCNYPARALGVSKLMSIKEAMQRCPELVTINGEDLTPYREASKRMLGVLRRYGTVQKLGLDEVFVDVTAEAERRLQGNRNTSTPVQWAGHIHTPGEVQLMQDSKHRPMDLRAGKDESSVNTPMTGGVGLNSEMEERYGKELWWRRLAMGSVLAREARDTLKGETGLRTSAGIACNKMLAKLVSGLHKPDDQTVLMPPYAAEFVGPLPVRAISGIGHKTEAELIAGGVTTVSEARSVHEAELKRIAGDRAGSLLALACWGNDPSEVVEQGPSKSVTVEDSFRGCKGHIGAAQVLAVLAPDLVARLQEEEEDNGRRPTKLTVKWRIKGQGWNRTSASCAFPAVALGQKGSTIDPSNSNTAAAAGIATAAGQVLAANLKEPFDLTLINIGATGFVDKQGAPVAGRSVADMLRRPQQAMDGQKPTQSTAMMSTQAFSPNSCSIFEGMINQQQDVIFIPAASATAAPAVIPKVLAGQSAKRRRDYGNGDHAPLSKRAERMLREGPPSNTTTPGSNNPQIGPIPGSKNHGPMGSDEEWGADDDSVLWQDLAGLHNSKSSGAVSLLRNKGSSANGNTAGIPYGAHEKPLPSSLAQPLQQPSACSASPDQRVVIHCDIDSFYCAVERLDDPSLANVPLAVEQFNSGGFVAVSYEARAAGIRCGDGAGSGGRIAVPHLAAMKARSIEECRIACPGLIVRRMRPHRYREVGHAVHALLKRVTQGHDTQVEKASCDDFYIDASELALNMISTMDPPPGSKIIQIQIQQDKAEVSSFASTEEWRALHHSLQAGAWIAYRVRETLRSELSLSGSCGVGRNKLISRLASPVNKPNGLTIVPDESSVPFIRTVPLRRVPSLKGKFGTEVESQLQVRFVGDLLKWTKEELVNRFGGGRGGFLADITHATDTTLVIDRGPPKTLTAERSFPPAQSQTDVATALRSLVDNVMVRTAQDYEEYSRLPVKFGVAFRLGYDTNLISRSGPVPLPLMRWLRTPNTQNTDLKGAAMEASLNAALSLLSKASNGRWDVTRAAVVFFFSENSKNTSRDEMHAGPSIGDIFMKGAPPSVIKNPTADAPNGPESSHHDVQAQGIANTTKASQVPKATNKFSAPATYRNAEALALQNMFNKGSGNQGIPLIEGEAGEEERASLELALRLQREEAQAAGSSRQFGEATNQAKRGPLDSFLIPKFK